MIKYMNTNPAVSAQSRDAGRQVVHTLKFFNEVVRTRRSATRRYRFVICHWFRAADGTSHLISDRWSDSPKCSLNQFAVPVVPA